VAKTVILHLSGENPVFGEIAEEPDPSDMFIKVTNMRTLDGKEVPYLAEGVESVIFPWHRVTFIEVLTSGVETEEVVGFFR
jgi:hypothetical protein